MSTRSRPIVAHSQNAGCQRRAQDFWRLGLLDKEDAATLHIHMGEAPSSRRAPSLGARQDAPGGALRSSNTTASLCDTVVRFTVSAHTHPFRCRGRQVSSASLSASARSTPLRFQGINISGGGSGDDGGSSSSGCALPPDEKSTRSRRPSGRRRAQTPDAPSTCRAHRRRRRSTWPRRTPIVILFEAVVARAKSTRMASSRILRASASVKSASTPCAAAAREVGAETGRLVG